MRYTCFSSPLSSSTTGKFRTVFVTVPTMSDSFSRSAKDVFQDFTPTPYNIETNPSSWSSLHDSSAKFRTPSALSGNTQVNNYIDFIMDTY